MLAANIHAALSTFPECPGASAACIGTAWDRLDSAVLAARAVDLNRPWDHVRNDILAACGLRAQTSTEHCFNDFNHVDCCAMLAENTHRTNEESRVMGMHAVNQLGPHILDASVRSHGDGGSWCTCHLSAPYDVCHRQFGARTAFKLVWCEGSQVAALLDDDANVLSFGKPIQASAPSTIPAYGGPRARADAWKVLVHSTNSSWAERWVSACEAIVRRDADDVETSAHGKVASSAHEEL
uniref:Uncharacterized protein n=1 Tax=Coccolithus braarudii TaxID=221442 RepID=A0A7S0Q5V7_9EUKA|mmetsp:Transcript_40421/g.86190  ORF Transcript_40421/g.86190 Transcript_40421/m.86190 type:complete len:239 (+) Transcript_40421:29-745(+)